MEMVILECLEVNCRVLIFSRHQASPVPESVSMDAVRFIQVTRELSAVVFSAAASLLLRSALGIQEDSLSNKVNFTNSS